MRNAGCALDTLSWSPSLALALEEAAVAVGRLDARYGASSVASAWKQRAAWTGYARGLQLQGSEIDEIDIFSWGCGLPVAGRQRRASTIDEFSGFAPWWQSLAGMAADNWRDRIGFSPALPGGGQGGPAILRALEVVRQCARHDPTIAAWLWLPELVKAFGAAENTLPCLVEGAKAFRLRAQPANEDWRTQLRAIARSARAGLDRLEALEGYHRRSVAALAAERRPGALISVLALAAARPLLSPQMVADQLKLSLPGAGKVLQRAADLNLLVEVSGRRAWRRYLVPDLAVSFGLIPAPRGRPARVGVADVPDRDLADILRAFDEEMRQFDALLPEAGQDAG